MKIPGEKKLIKQLQRLANKNAPKRLLKKAANAAGSAAVRAVRQEAPKDSGALKKATTKKVVGKGTSMTTIVGADKAATGPDGSQPWRYDHLVNNGFQLPDGSNYPGLHYLERGVERAEPTIAKAYADKLDEAIQKEMSR